MWSGGDAYSHLVRTANGCSLYGMMVTFFGGVPFWIGVNSLVVVGIYTDPLKCHRNFQLALIATIKFAFFFVAVRVKICLSCTCTTDMMIACPIRLSFPSRTWHLPDSAPNRLEEKRWASTGVEAGVATSGTLGSAWASTPPPDRCPVVRWAHVATQAWLSMTGTRLSKDPHLSDFHTRGDEDDDEPLCLCRRISKSWSWHQRVPEPRSSKSREWAMFSSLVANLELYSRVCQLKFFIYNLVKSFDNIVRVIKFITYNSISIYMY